MFIELVDMLRRGKPLICIAVDQIATFTECDEADEAVGIRCGITLKDGQSISVPDSYASLKASIGDYVSIVTESEENILTARRNGEVAETD